MSETATPRPWFRSPVQSDAYGCEMVTIGPFDVSDKPDPNHFEDTICEVWGGNHHASANADLIVRAVNNHDALVASLGRQLAAQVSAGAHEKACQWCHSGMGCDWRGWNELEDSIEQMRSALAAASK